MTLPTRARLDGVLIDIGGVLIGPDWDRVTTVLAKHGITVAAARLSAAELSVKRKMDQPGPDPESGRLYYDRVLRQAGYAPPVASEVWADVLAEHARYHFWHLVLPGVTEALSLLGAAGLRLAVVSNSTGIARRLLEDVGLVSHFQEITDSQIEQIEKPHPEIFRRAVARIGVQPDRAVHVGDLYNTDVVGARAAGIGAALIDVAGLYGDADCARFDSLLEFAQALVG